MNDDLTASLLSIDDFVKAKLVIEKLRMMKVIFQLKIELEVLAQRARARRLFDPYQRQWPDLMDNKQYEHEHEQRYVHSSTLDREDIFNPERTAPHDRVHTHFIYSLPLFIPLLNLELAFLASSETISRGKLNGFSVNSGTG